MAYLKHTFIPARLCFMVLQPTVLARIFQSCSTGSFMTAECFSSFILPGDMAAAKAPKEVPETTSMGMPSSCIALITPKCTLPLAPPPPKQTPTAFPAMSRATLKARRQRKDSLNLSKNQENKLSTPPYRDHDSLQKQMFVFFILCQSLSYVHESHSRCPDANDVDIP